MRKKTKAEQYQDWTEEYKREGNKWPATKWDLADWAISTGRFQPKPRDFHAICASEFVSSWREQYHVDPQGRRVRTKHAYAVDRALPDGTTQQMVLWDDMKNMAPKEMRSAAQLRREQILGDCRQLHNDVGSYNENHAKGSPIVPPQLDFMDDIAEMEAARAYSEQQKQAKRNHRKQISDDNRPQPGA